MSDVNITPKDPRFETDEVSADRAREQGLGVGERELAAKRDPGGVKPLDPEERRADEDGDVERIDIRRDGQDQARTPSGTGA